MPLQQRPKRSIAKITEALYRRHAELSLRIRVMLAEASLDFCTIIASSILQGLFVICGQYIGLQSTDYRLLKL